MVKVKSIYRSTDSEKLFLAAYEHTLQSWPVPNEAIDLNTRFGSTHVIACGPVDANPLVLLHGFAFSSTVWIDNIFELSQTNRVYAVDFIGDINKSHATKQIQSIEDCVQWFEDVLGGLQIEKTSILGHSYGGYLALTLAAKIPTRLDKVIGLSPGAALQPQSKRFFFRCMMAGMLPSTRRLERLMNYMMARGNTVNQRIRHQFIVAMQTCIPRVQVFARYLSNEDLARVKVPTLILIGEHEVQYDAKLAIQRALTVLPNVKATLVPKAGHGLPIEQPKIVNTYCTEFLMN